MMRFSPSEILDLYTLLYLLVKMKTVERTINKFLLSLQVKLKLSIF